MNRRTIWYRILYRLFNYQYGRLPYIFLTKITCLFIVSILSGWWHYFGILEFVTLNNHSP